MKQKAAIIGFSCLGGAVLSAITAMVYAVFVLAFCLLMGFLLLWKKKSACVFFLSVAFGVFVFQIFYVFQYKPVIEYDGQVLDVQAKILEKSKTTSDTCSYVLSADIDGRNIKFNLYGQDVAADYGDYLSFRAKFSLPKNNSAFSEYSYLFSRGIYLRAQVISDIQITKTDVPSPFSYLLSYREYLKNKILSNISGDTGALLTALFLGDTSSISGELKSNILYSGVSHMTAVSGMHLTLILHVIMLLLSITPLKNRRVVTFCILLFLIVSLVVFFKMTPSVVRSGFMLAFYYGGSVVGRKSSALNSVGAAAFLMVLMQPYACLDAGFLLSVAGTVGIGAVAPAVEQKLKPSRFSSLRSVLIGTIAANICTLPLTALYFGGTSLISPITNLLLQPFSVVALICVVAFAILGGSVGFFLMLSGVMCRFMVWIIHACGNIPYSYISLNSVLMLPLMLVSVIFLAIVFLRYKDIRKRIYAVSVTCAVFLSGIMIHRAFEFNNVKMEIYTDGVASCVLVRKQNTVIALASHDKKSIADYLSHYLKTNQLNEFTYLSVANEKYNAVSYFEAIPVQRFLLSPDENTLYRVSNLFTISNTETVQSLSFQNTTLSFLSVKQPASTSDFCVYYDYRRSDFTPNGSINILTHRLQNTNGHNNTIHAFHQTVRIQFSEDGSFRFE